MSEELPVLYTFRRCPYAMRARMAIAVSGIVCRLREVVLRDKPEDMLAASPKGTVPVIVEASGQVIDESLDVMFWSLGQNDPERWLAPAAATQDEMLTLIARNDGPFKHALDRYKYPNRYDGVDRDRQRAKGVEFLQFLNERLGASRYLFGAQVSVADIAIFPFVRQFANTDRDWFDAQPWPSLHRWLADHLSSDLFLSVMPKFKQWKPGDDEPIFPAVETKAT